MRDLDAGQSNPALKALVAEASCALARLDSARLEELALSCDALNRGLGPMSLAEKRELARQTRDAAADMAVFARVLDATRANVKVMNRLRDLREGRLEYDEGHAPGAAGMEAGNGNH